MYFLLGSAIGLLIVTAIFVIHRPHHWDFAMIGAVTVCVNCGSLAVHIARRRGWVESIEELHRPLTLFPRDPA